MKTDADGVILAFPYRVARYGSLRIEFYEHGGIVVRRQGEELSLTARDSLALARRVDQLEREIHKQEQANG